VIGTAQDELLTDVLQEYGALTRAAIVERLPRAAPHRYLYNLVADYPGRGGKMMRSSLCIATARAFGARLEDALPCAVAIELIHNAILVHDDIEDESLTRRGLPTLHRMHGVSLALNAGDTLTLMSLTPLIESWRLLGPRLAAQVLEETMSMARETAEGQAMELGWRRENVLHLDETDYLAMVLKKTCALATIYPLRVGALVGARGRVDLEPFIRFGFFIGAAFQIQDDLLNLDSELAYGKEHDGDLWEGKRTLMLIRLLNAACADERREIAAILARPRGERTVEQIRWLKRLMDRYRCLDYARAFARGLTGAALHEYGGVFAGLPDSRDKRFIQSLITWVTGRTA
jgi:geranylgeranyl diphosphate synthase, type II